MGNVVEIALALLPSLVKAISDIKALIENVGTAEDKESLKAELDKYEWKAWDEIE